MAWTVEHSRIKQKQYLQTQLNKTRVIRINKELKLQLEELRRQWSNKLGRKFTINEMMQSLLDNYNIF